MGSALQILNSKSTHIRAQSQIDAARITQKSGNERRAAEADLNRTAQSLGNRRALDAAGAEVAAINENIVRNLDASTAGTLSQRIAAAEEMGSVLAGAAAAGVGGSSLDLYKATLTLNSAMTEERQGRAIASDQYSAGQAKGSVLENAIGSLDNTSFQANMDFTQYVDHKEMSDLSKFLAFSGAAAATYYGGPQAGMAVLDVFQSREDARNGDFGSAGAKLDRAVAGGVQGWKNYTSLGGKGKVGEAWGKKSWDSVNNILKSIKL